MASTVDHFTDHELGLDVAEIPFDAAANIRVRLEPWLEAARAILGVPLEVTSAYRSPEHNAAVGGASDSDHVTGLAADVVPVGMTKLEAYRRLQSANEAGRLPPFDQLIYYALDDHVHIGLGSRLRRQVLLEDVEGGVKRYRVLTAELAAQLWGSLPGPSLDGAPRGCCRA